MKQGSWAIGSTMVLVLVMSLAAAVPSPNVERALASPRDTASTEPPQVTSLAWLAGRWVSEDGTVEESWFTPTSNLMLGVNHTVSDGRSRAFEFLRVEASEEGLTYVANPNGRPGTRFVMVHRTESEVTFENLEHDFPQRIEYRREDDSLHVRISGDVDGQTRAAEWTWKRVSSGP